MVIININSQLGNQMFQYALYRKLLYLGRNVKLDTNYFISYPEQFRLNIFNLKLNIANEKEIHKVKDEYKSYTHRIRRKLFGKRQSIFEEVTSRTLCFKPEIFSLVNAYVDGYWQTERYFKDIRQILLEEFSFPTLHDQKNKELVEKIMKTLSISIHIRRGDYINGFPLMTKEYYQNAIKYFNEKYETVFYVVFSNDLDWAKENIKLENGVFVDWNTGANSYKDMYLMTLCKHNIIANSSFSWWGAWLNQNPKKEVLAPSIWLYHQLTPDIYCEDWKVLPVNL